MSDLTRQPRCSRQYVYQDEDGSQRDKVCTHSRSFHGRAHEEGPCRALGCQCPAYQEDQS